MTKLKILIVGPERSGKTMISDYLYNDNRDKPKIYRPTTGVRILEFERTIQDLGQEKSLSIELWDLSGNMQYEGTWNGVQSNVDGIILVVKGDKQHQKDEIEGWINNFPKKLKMSPNSCLGFANHISGTFKDDTPLKYFSVNFNHSCFEKRGTTIGP